MTKRELAFVACRVLALVLAVWAVEGLSAFALGLGQLLSTLRASGGKGPMSEPVWTGLEWLILALRPLFYAVIAWIAWFRTSALAGWVAGERADQPIETRVDVNDLITAGFMVVGIVLTATGLAGTVQSVVRMVREATTLDVTPTGWDIASLAGSIVRFGFGVWLLVGGRGILPLLQSMRGRRPRAQAARQAGLPTVEPPAVRPSE